MRVLVACEYSGVVREAFRAKGHEAWSCDLLPAEDESHYHVQQGILEFLKEGEAWGRTWDLMIAHPPCTYLCNSGVRWLWKDGELDIDGRWQDMCYASDFFYRLWNAPIPRIAIENPVPHGYAALPHFTQTIQPFMFGDDASKRTCLWLKNLPPLSIPSEDTWVRPRIVDGKKRWANQAPCGADKTKPSPTRGLERARTYQGIANAMASAWG